MSIENLLVFVSGYSIQFALLVGLAFLAMFLTRTKHPGSNLYFWQSVLGLALILPFLDTAVKISSPIIDYISRFEVETLVLSFSGSESFSFWLPLMISILLLGIVFNLGKLVLGLLRLRIINKTAAVIDPLSESLVSLKKIFNKHCSVKISPEISAPLTFGFLKPVILVPERFRLLDDAQQKCIICHELLHIGRRDWLLNLGEQIIKSVLWFHPAVYFLIKEITLSREKLIDERVVEIIGKRQVYLKAIWKMIQPDTEKNLYPTVPFAAKSHLVKRISFLSNENELSRKQCKNQLATTAMSFLMVMLLTFTVGQSVAPIGLDSFFFSAAEANLYDASIIGYSTGFENRYPFQFDGEKLPELVKKIECSMGVDRESPYSYSFQQGCLGGRDRMVNLVMDYVQRKEFNSKYYSGSDSSDQKSKYPRQDKNNQRIPEEILHSAVVMVDTDNGLELKSSGAEDFHKSIKLSETRNLYQQMDETSFLVIYQPFPFIRYEVFLDGIDARIQEQLHCPAPVSVFNSHSALVILAKNPAARKSLLKHVSRHIRKDL